MSTSLLGAAPSICAPAIAMIVGFEVTGKSVYEKRFLHPTWPGGDSGVTIGIGFDLGYETKDDLDREFPNLLAETRAQLERVIGLRGAAAKSALSLVSGCIVSWDDAMAAFEVSLHRYAAQAVNAFPGSDRIPSECFGALVSLVYNRGTSMTGDKRREMAAIRDLIQAGKLDDVPAQFRSMKRLWPDMKGLRDRREKEAQMWEAGLKS